MVVSESGLNTADDLAALARDGVRAFLIGESPDAGRPDAAATCGAALAAPVRAA